MGIYGSRVFPWLIDVMMSPEQFSTIRRSLLAEVGGDALEIGFGTGLNLEHYPPSLRHLTAIDINPGMSRRAARRVSSFDREIDVRIVNGEALPFGDDTFDCAVSTWTLCSVPDVGRALQEIRRVLKPHGRFFFAEHGLSEDEHIRRWQHRLTPIQKKIGDGCHLNRDIRQLLVDAGFSIEKLDMFYMEKTPKIGGFLYRGIAVRS
jgi:ubiquinone/menaquinone biosynthesis C-methylase UbiE